MRNSQIDTHRCSCRPSRVHRCVECDWPNSPMVWCLDRIFAATAIDHESPRQTFPDFPVWNEEFSLLRSVLPLAVCETNKKKKQKQKKRNREWRLKIGILLHLRGAMICTRFVFDLFQHEWMESRQYNSVLTPSSCSTTKHRNNMHDQERGTRMICIRNEFICRNHVCFCFSTMHRAHALWPCNFAINLSFYKLRWFRRIESARFKMSTKEI